MGKKGTSSKGRTVVRPTRPIALGEGTRARGEVLATVDSEGRWKPEKGVTARELKNLALNPHAYETVDPNADDREVQIASGDDGNDGGDGGGDAQGGGAEGQAGQGG